MGQEIEQTTTENSKNSSLPTISAALFEFISKLLIERTFFQNNAISPMMLIYIVNDVIQAFHKTTQQPEKLSLYKELAILYKQMRGQELTEDEKRYDQEIHELDVIGEVFSGVRYALGFSVFKGMFSSVTSAISQKLTEHVPAIVGLTAASYLGPLLFAKLVDISLAKTKLTEQQKNLLRPWLNTLGRLLISFTPKVEANQSGVTYQYPSPSGYSKWYRTISIQEPVNNRLNRLPDKENINVPPTEESLSFKIVGIKSIAENKIEISVTNPKNELHSVKLSLTEKDTARDIRIECTDPLIEDECYYHLSKIFSVSSEQQLVIPAAPELESPALQQQSSFDSFISNARNFASSMVVPSVVLAASRVAFSKTPDLRSRTQAVLWGLFAQFYFTSAINPRQNGGDNADSLMIYNEALAIQTVNYYKSPSEMLMGEDSSAVKMNYRKPRAKLENGDVNPMSTEYQVNTIVDANQQNSAVAKLSDGNLLYIYETYPYFTPGNGLLVKVLTPYGEEVIPELPILAAPAGSYINAIYPNLLILPNGDFYSFIVGGIDFYEPWNILGGVYSFNNTSVNLVSFVGGGVVPGSTSIILNNDQILLLMCSNYEGIPGWAISFHNYSLDGQPIGGPTNYTATAYYCNGLSSSTNPAGGYAIASMEMLNYNIEHPTSIITQQNIYIYPVNSQGTQLSPWMVSSNFTINTNAVIQSFPNSNWILVYNANNNVTEPVTTNFAIYDFTWQLLSPMINLGYPINFPSVAISENNNFVILGQMYTNMTVFYDVVGLFFNSTGQVIGNLFVAHDYVHDVQVSYVINPVLNDVAVSSVVVNLDGDDFSMTYTSESQDGSMNGVFARYFDSSFGVYTANWTVTFPEGSIFNGLNDFSNPAFYNPNTIYYLTLSNPMLGNLTVTIPPITCQVSYNPGLGQMIIAGQSNAINKEVFPYLQLPTNPYINGLFNLNVTAVDLSNFNPTFYRLMTLNVTAVNYPPVAPQIPSQVVLVGSDYNFTFPAFEGNEPISYSAALVNGSQLPPWLDLDSVARQFYSVSPPTQFDVTLNALAINVIGNDSYGETANVTFFMSVVPSLSADNLNPTYTYTENTPIYLTQALNIATPRNRVKITLRIFACSTGILNTVTVGNTTSFFNASSCELSAEGSLNEINTLYTLTPFNPTLNSFINVPIIQTIDDFFNNPLSGMISLQGIQVNYPPSVAHNIPNQVETVGTPFTISVLDTFNNPNNEDFTYIAYAINQTMPDWIRFDNQTFFGNASNIGVFYFGVAAFDPFNNSASSNFSITVINPRGGPGGLRSWEIALIVLGTVALAVSVGGIVYWCVKDSQQRDPFEKGLFENEIVKNRPGFSVNEPGVRGKIKEIKPEVSDLPPGIRLRENENEKWIKMGSCFGDALTLRNLSKNYKDNREHFTQLFHTDNKTDRTRIMARARLNYFDSQPAEIKEVVGLFWQNRMAEIVAGGGDEPLANIREGESNEMEEVAAAGTGLAPAP